MPAFRQLHDPWGREGCRVIAGRWPGNRRSHLTYRSVLCGEDQGAEPGSQGFCLLGACVAKVGPVRLLYHLLPVHLDDETMRSLSVRIFARKLSCFRFIARTFFDATRINNIRCIESTRRGWRSRISATVHVYQVGLFFRPFLRVAYNFSLVQRAARSLNERNSFYSTECGSFVRRN